MKQEVIIKGETEAEVWAQLTNKLAKEETVLEYKALILQGRHEVVLDIDIDLGGGFESGYAFTSFMATVASSNDFTFTIHEEDLLDEAGKLFGMQDVVIGYPEFDDKVIIKTNNEERVKSIFEDKDIRTGIKALPDFKLKLVKADDAGNATLLLRIEKAFSQINDLKAVYGTFICILNKLSA